MAVKKILFFFTCLCFAREFVFCDDYKEIGKDITLTPSIRGKPEEILWKHNENKVLEYDGSEMVEYGSFKGRVVVDFETGQLTIHKLNSQDSGQYQSDILINGKVQTSSHTLTVLDALPEPRVTCESNEASNAKKLLCSVDSRTQLSYEWSGPNINVQSGPELHVDEQEESRDSVYTCTVTNQFNSKSTDFTLKDCLTGKAGSTALLPAIIVPLLLLLLLIPLAIFLYRRCRPKEQKQARHSELNEIDPENGQNQIPKVTTESRPGPSDANATIPSHSRLPYQKESIADKKWDQDTGSYDSGETEKLLQTDTLQEQNLKLSPQPAVKETNQENTGNGYEGELNNEKKNTVEENTYSKPDETEEERHKPLHRQEEEEEETSQILKQENEKQKSSERLEEQKTEDNNEDNQTPGETTGRPDSGQGQNLLRNDPTESMPGPSNANATIPSHSRLPYQKESIADKKWDQDTGSHDSGETEKLLQTDTLQEQNLKLSPQPAVKETNQENTGNGYEGELNNEKKNTVEENTYSKPDETEEERHKPLHRQEEEEEETSQIMKQENEKQKSSERLEEQKTEDNNEDNQTPGETTGRPDSETVSPQSAVTETNMDNKAEQVQDNEIKGQNDDDEQSPEQQNESLRNQKTKDTDNSENDMRSEEKKETSEEENHEGIDGPNTAESCNRPAVDQPSDSEPPSAPAVTDLPANLENKPINSSVSSSSQTETNQEQKGGQEQTPEEKNHDSEISEVNTCINFDK